MVARCYVRRDDIFLSAAYFVEGA
ncbi:MAG: hypothetical protein RIS36_1543, partial [Pseudomonadota bacterium]